MDHKGVRLRMIVTVCDIEIADWEPSRIKAFFGGIAQIHAAIDGQIGAPSFDSLSVRARRHLESFGKTDFRGAAELTEDELLCRRGCGITATQEIKTALAKHGLSFKETQ